MMITIPARFEPLALKKIFVLTLFCLSMLLALCKLLLCQGIEG